MTDTIPVEVTHEGDTATLKLHFWITDKLKLTGDQEKDDKAIELISENMIAQAKAFASRDGKPSLMEQIDSLTDDELRRLMGPDLWARARALAQER